MTPKEQEPTLFLSTDCLFCLTGTVVQGNQLGRTLGFPTANIQGPENEQLELQTGVYAVFINNNGQWYQGMANIGTRPTVDGSHLVVEVNLFNFQGDLYGFSLVIYFIERLRNEIKFQNLTDLKLQLNLDKASAIRSLSRRRQADSNAFNTI